MKLALIAECKSYLWIFAGLLPGYVAAGYIYFAKYGGLLMEEQIVINNMADQMLNGMINYMEHGLYISMVVLLYLVMVVSSAIVIRKCIKGGKEQ